jgi:putative iron-regulated protein
MKSCRQYPGALADFVHFTSLEAISLSYRKRAATGFLFTAILSLSAVTAGDAADRTTATQAESAAGQTVSRGLSYRLTGSERRSYNYDAKSEIQAYAQLVADSYGAALIDAQLLKAATDAFLAMPSDETLLRARDAWRIARRSWEQTEAFRFYDGPIDISDTGAGPLERMDGWPVDPAVIDYVQNNPTSGIINNMKLAVTRATLASQSTPPGGSRPVTTGWHVIEFLLWGQEVPLAGEPGDRPVTDYLPGQPNNDRRRTYLKLSVDLLIDDMRYLVESWDARSPSSYSTAFRVLNQREALGRILNGIAQLAGKELATNRLASALDSKDFRMLTSRFSVNSEQDLIFALRGIRNVWTGDQGGETRPGLSVLLTRVDPALAQRISHTLNHAEESMGALRTPLERETLPAAPNTPARQSAERAIADLKRLAGLIRDAGVKLGVAVTLPN